jgi:hypothetical protein
VASNERYSKVLQITYVLKFEAIAAGCHMNVVMEFPIVIGSAPLNLNQTTTNASLTQPSYNPNVTMPLPSAPMSHSDFSNPMTDLRKFFSIIYLQMVKLLFVLKHRHLKKL